MEKTGAPTTLGAGATTAERSFSSVARAWLGIAFGILVVVVSTTLLIKWRSDARRTALLADYDRAAAHLAGQVHLRQENSCQLASAKSSSSSFIREDTEHPAISCDPRPPVDGPRGEVAKFLIPDSEPRRCIAVSTADLLDRRSSSPTTNPSARARRFAQYFLVDDAGRVLASRSESASLQLETVVGWGKQRVPRSLDLSLGTQEFYGFVRPVSVPAACAGRLVEPLAKFSVYAVVNKKDVERDSLHIGPGYFLWAFFALSLGVLLLPLAKLWFIGRTSRFTSLDVAMLGVTSVCTTLLTTVVILGFVARMRLTEELDDTLSRTSDALALRMTAELQSASALLDWFPPRSYDARPRPFFPLVPERLFCEYDAQPRPFFPLVPERLFCEHDAAPARSTSRSETGLAQPSTGHYFGRIEIPPREDFPNWNLAFWADKDGNQRLKFDHKDKPTPFINLRGRRYLERAHQSGLAAVESNTKSGFRSTSAEVVRSATTGQFVLLVARPDRARLTAADPQPGVLGVFGVETPLDVVRKQVTPMGVQTAVIDRQGRVMVHSDIEAQIGQNFFDQVGQDSGFRELVSAKLSASLSVEYQSTPSRVWARPIEGGWTAIAVAPTALVDEPTQQTVLLALSAMAILYATLLVGFVLYRIVCWLSSMAGTASPSAHREGLPAPFLLRFVQPDARLAHRYLRLAFSSFGVGAVLAVLGLALVPEPLLYALWGLYASAFGLFAARWRATPEVQPQHPRSASRAHFCFAFASFGLTTFFVVAPAASLFSQAFDDVAEGQARARQHNLAAQLERNPECIENPDACLFAPPLAVSKAPPPRDVTPWLPLRPTRYLSSVLPWLSYPEAGDSGALLRATAQTAKQRHWSWTRSNFDLHCKTSSGLLLTSRLPTLLTNHYDGVVIGLLVVLFFLGFVPLSGIVAYRSMRRMFFADLLSVEPRSRPVNYAALRNGASRQLVLFPRPTAIEELRNGTCETRQARLVSGPFPVHGSPSEPCSRPLVLTDLAPLLGDPVALSALEGLVAAHSDRIIFLSSVDWTLRAPLSLRPRWAALLTQFTCVEDAGMTDRGPPEAGWTEAAFLHWWEGCDEAEKLLLAQIARQGCPTPHPENRASLQHLIRRGLLTPYRLDFRHAQFRNFVHDFATRDGLYARQPATEVRSAWSSLRVPLSTSVAMILLCFGVTLPELTGAGLGGGPLLALFQALVHIIAK